MTDDDLHLPPSDPQETENYPELYRLWKQMQDRQTEGRPLSDHEFRDWEASVESLLRSLERARFKKPLPSDPIINQDNIQLARNFWLHRILRARQGWERLMKDDPD